MKYLKKFNESESDDKFTSRLDGGEMSKSDFEKRGDFWKPKSMSDDDFDNEFKSTMRGIGSSFNDDSTDPNLVLKLLKTCWNTDESILKSVADYFKSFDYANHFMEEYDSNDGDMDLAWDSFVSRYHWDSDQSKFNESVDLYSDGELQHKAWEFCQRWDSDILFRLLGQDDEGNEVPMGDIRSLLNKVSDLGDYSIEEWIKFFEDLRENGI